MQLCASTAQASPVLIVAGQGGSGACSPGIDPPQAMASPPSPLMTTSRLRVEWPTKNLPAWTVIIHDKGAAASASDQASQALHQALGDQVVVWLPAKLPDKRHVTGDEQGKCRQSRRQGGVMGGPEQPGEDRTSS